jgi:uncharacterized membrane protein YbhN (UPF0104 family)
MLLIYFNLCPSVNLDSHFTFLTNIKLNLFTILILYLILSTISIFIPVSGGVGRGQVHCFAQGGGL